MNLATWRAWVDASALVLLVGVLFLLGQIYSEVVTGRLAVARVAGKVEEGMAGRQKDLAVVIEMLKEDRSFRQSVVRSLESRLDAIEDRIEKLDKK